MSVQVVFDPRLGVFRHHFEHDPIVPGVMLIDYYVAQGVRARPDRMAAGLSDVRFQQFVRPGEPVDFTSCHSGEVRVERNGAACCTFKLDIAQVRLLASAATSKPGSMRALRIGALRDPDYWFLDDEIEVDHEGRMASCHVDMVALERRHGYLAEMPRWRPLVLIECAGNLALALQHLAEPGGARSRYVFARFGEIAYRTDCSLWEPRQTVVTHVKRFGTMLVWEATVSSPWSTQIVIRGAVSHGGKTQ